jgi:hypothetical protein
VGGLVRLVQSTPEVDLLIAGLVGLFEVRPLDVDGSGREGADETAGGDAGVDADGAEGAAGSDDGTGAEELTSCGASTGTGGRERMESVAVR